MSGLMPGAIAAVVTTFSPSPPVVENLRRVAAQVRLVVVVDDSGRGAAAELIASAGLDNLSLLANEQNMGIAASLNRGLAYAASHNLEWAITLDDDTLISGSYVQDVFDFIDTHKGMNIGAVACRRQSEGGKENVDNRDEEGAYREKRNLITSGCVFRLATFHQIGGFDERMFIDLVDFDFCARLRKAGYKVMELKRAGMAHTVGSSRLIRCLGFAVTVYNHAPFRLYYQVRNVFLFAAKHWRFDVLLCCVLLLDTVRIPFKALLFETQKSERLRYVLAGLIDGCLGRGGRVRQRF